MSLWKIAWRSLQQRGLASLLTALSMALGVMLVVTVLSIHGIVSESFSKSSSLGYNMIVGAKGGRLQLALNTVFYLSQPIENIPYDYYLEFLPLEQRQQQAKLARLPRPDLHEQEGKFAAYTAQAIPVCLGDYFGRFRVVGTTPAMLELVYDHERDRRHEFAQGRNFQHHSPEHGFFEAVVGATVAREMNVQLGDEIKFTHGDPEGAGHGQGFTVVGILEPSGRPNDRAVLVNMEGFFLMDGHAKPLDEQRLAALEEAGWDPDEAGSAADGQPLSLEQREVTAILVKTAQPIFAIGLENTINKGDVAQAVPPFAEIVRLFENIVNPIQWTLLALTAVICLVSGVSILVSIYNSMSDRRRDIAVMRALGASRDKIMSVILLESIFLSLGGGMLGWLGGHTLKWLASSRIEQQTGVAIGFFDFAPPINLLELIGRDPTIAVGVSPELLLIPALILLAILVGFLPAVSAYRTDVAKSLQS